MAYEVYGILMYEMVRGTDCFSILISWLQCLYSHSYIIFFGFRVKIVETDVDEDDSGDDGDGDSSKDDNTTIRLKSGVGIFGLWLHL